LSILSIGTPSHKWRVRVNIVIVALPFGNARAGIPEGACKRVAIEPVLLYEIW
jgi:hypothetical protein